ncbi:MAG: hypothetical protein FWE90_10410 [Defluviitaleaceae bacterium]|nr:hypothetical protein [Defluviitaleaceae bacterium]
MGRRFNRSLTDFETAVTDGFDFTQSDGFGETLHRNIHEWFNKTENQTLWKELQDMTTIENKTSATAAETSGNPFTGRNIVVMGKLNHFTRDSINARIESLGAKAGSAVSKATDYLVAGDKAGSKLGKAQSLGIPVLSEQQFLQMAESA